MSENDFVHSDVDEQLLFSVPFTANVKLTGIIFSGPLSGSFPSTVRLFKDRGNMSFDDCENAKEDQQIELKQDSDASIDYPLMSSKFNSVGHLTLYFPANFGDEKTIIYISSNFFCQLKCRGEERKRRAKDGRQRNRKE
uniref:PITH domain-containing protein n=1 Tax=Meloidogyne enterolobii TaxID=390850 RepID=A0A6V7TSY8_MELEN|nr:unnamed protein product [Meloidogyne enterolobii]